MLIELYCQRPNAVDSMYTNSDHEVAFGTLRGIKLSDAEMLKHMKAKAVQWEGFGYECEIAIDQHPGDIMNKINTIIRQG